MTIYRRLPAALAGMATACILALGLGAAPAGAQTLVEHVTQSCQTELTTYCSQVTPGECAQVQPGQGRIAECLAANQSSLSPTCTQALTDVGAQ